jgi:hypothetical protein
MFSHYTPGSILVQACAGVCYPTTHHRRDCVSSSLSYNLGVSCETSKITHQGLLVEHLRVLLILQRIPTLIAPFFLEDGIFGGIVA